MREKKSLTEVKQDYIYFQKNYIDFLQNAKNILNIKEFEYSLEEIDKMGLIYKENFKKPKQLNLTYNELLNSFISYCGEAWMHYFGGEWLYIKDKTNISFGYPQIIKWGPNDYPWSGIPPISWARRIEKNIDNESLNLPFHRKIHYFSVSEEWNKQMKK